jgi:hypothetical protein
LEALGVDVAVVTFDADVMATAYVVDTELSWPLLVDEDRALYQAYGMLHASFWDVWGPQTILAYLRAMGAGMRPAAPGRDVNQRGGDVLIDPEGIVRLHHIGRGPADRPEVSALLDVVREATP